MATMLFQGHGSYRFVLDDGYVIYVDPFAGEGYDLPANLILATHEHFDHTSFDKMPHAEGCKIVRAADLHPEPGVYNTTEEHGVRITAVQACNANHPIEECVGYLIELDGKTFYASGDTSTTEHMESGYLAQQNIDYAVFPCDGRYNMGVEEASECARKVNAAHSIPVHMVAMNDPSDPSQLFGQEVADAFDGPGKVVLRPGEELELR